VYDTGRTRNRTKAGRKRERGKGSTENHVLGTFFWGWEERWYVLFKLARGEETRKSKEERRDVL